jgi:hypothetical protein
MFGVSPLMAESTLPLTAAVSPMSVSHSAAGSNQATTNATCTAAGGFPSYTFSWSRISGSTAISATAPSAATTAFSTSGLAIDQTRTAVFVCTVTDAAGQVVQSSNVSVSLHRLGFTATAQPEEQSVNTGTASTGRSGDVTCTFVNGPGAPYFYQWAQIVGDTMGITDLNSPTTDFTVSGLAAGQTKTAIFVCEVISDGGNATSNPVTVSFKRNP